MKISLTAGGSGGSRSARFRAPSSKPTMRRAPAAGLRGSIILLLGLLLLGHDALLPAASAADPAVPEEAREFASLVNRHRASRGCGPLIWNGNVAAVAQRHSLDMASRRFFGHVNPDGLGPVDRLRRAGVPYRAAAENIARGLPDPDAAFQAWRASQPHRRNLENCSYTHHGMGMHRGHWTHVLLRG